jgi:hypothetical protein
MIQLHGGGTVALEPTGTEPHVALLNVSDDVALFLTMHDLDSLILEAHAVRQTILDGE